jgi:hypothetical protein
MTKWNPRSPKRVLLEAARERGLANVTASTPNRKIIEMLRAVDSFRAPVPALPVEAVPVEPSGLMEILAEAEPVAEPTIEELVAEELAAEQRVTEAPAPLLPEPHPDTDLSKASAVVMPVRPKPEPTGLPGYVAPEQRYELEIGSVVERGMVGPGFEGTQAYAERTRGAKLTTYPAAKVGERVVLSQHGSAYGLVTEIVGGQARVKLEGTRYIHGEKTSEACLPLAECTVCPRD